MVLKIRWSFSFGPAEGQLEYKDFQSHSAPRPTPKLKK
jgi:hypothetical protein